MKLIIRRVTRSLPLSSVMLAFTIFVLSTLPAHLHAASPETTPSEYQTFTILYNNDSEEPYQNDWLILEEYRKRRGIVFDPRFGDDDNYNLTLTETLNSNNIPDIVLKVYPNEIAPYAGSGKLLAISDYLDKMPYFRAYIAEHNLEGEIDELRMEDGKLYILPGFQRPMQVQQWVYRKDLFAAHQLGVPETFGELIQDLAYLKTRYPRTEPITACWGGAHLMAMLGAAFGIPAGWNGNRYYQQERDSWKYAPATPNARALYTFLHTCNQEGLLDPELFTQDYAAYEQKLTDGTALVTATWITSGLEPRNQRLSAAGLPDGEWAPLPVPVSPLGVRALPPIDTFRKGLVIPADAALKPYFMRLLTFIDWAVYSEEGMELTSWGVEGVTFSHDESGNRFFLPGIEAIKSVNAEKIIKRDFGLDALFNLNENASLVEYKRPEEINTFLKASLERGDTAAPAPELPLSDTQMNTLQGMLPRINAYAADALLQFATGILDPDKDWETYLRELETRGYRSVEIIWNNAWDRSSR